jgi:ferredoxin
VFSGGTLEIPQKEWGAEGMVRKIVAIDGALCNGCGLCVKACHEGAIELREGRAVLVRDDYCDGLGNCLPACPCGAIRIEEREAAAYQDAAAKPDPPAAQNEAEDDSSGQQSALRNWPVQLRLVSASASWLRGADLLLCADCCAYASGGFHHGFLRGKKLLIGCPKLDEPDYREKLKAVFATNGIRSLTILRMEVPCCAGIVRAAQEALEAAAPALPWRVVVLSIDGRILREESR